MNMHVLLVMVYVSTGICAWHPFQYNKFVRRNISSLSVNTLNKTFTDKEEEFLLILRSNIPV